MRNMPAAKFASSPDQAAPMANPSAASKAAKEVVSMPRTDSTAMNSSSFIITFALVSI